ncbi:hypothetical protein PMAYCL1PPCAC_22508, partial [Pristionchus mayeri]
SWIVSSGIPWQWGLIGGPALTVLPLLVIMCLRNTLRIHIPEERTSLKHSFKNAFGILSIKSFALLTAAISLGSFHMSAYGFWFPTMILTAWTDFPQAFIGLSYTSYANVSRFKMGICCQNSIRNL